MRYNITHTTTYGYDEPVGICHNVVHLSPREVPRQTCSQHRIHVQPTPSSTTDRVDYFGNPVRAFTIAKSHRELVITSKSKMEVRPRSEIDMDSSPAWETVRAGFPADRSPDGLANYQFCFDSPHIGRSKGLMKYAQASFVDGRPIADAVLDLTQRIHADFTYDPKATTVSTPIEEVMQNKRGVCQDLAHVQIGCLRSLGLAARYISGYLRTIPPAGKPRLVGADASHAWVSAYCGELGWIDFDPTNAVVPSVDHITIAWGRDYSDVCPINGMFIGGGRHKMHVEVDVEPIDKAGSK